MGKQIAKLPKFDIPKLCKKQINEVRIPKSHLGVVF